LKHMAAHNASRAFAAVGRVTQPEKEAIPSAELPPPAPGIPGPVDSSALPLTQLVPM
jgi:hypothetical protein